MKSIRVLFVSQEITPYLPESEIATTSRFLPQGIQEKGKEIRTFMPRWGTINERRNQLHEVIRLSGMNLVINDTDHPLIIKVASIQSARMQVYFIDNEDYFHRKFELKNEKGEYYDDNDERAIFFARGVLETVKKLRWSPDIVHCHGWFPSFIPIMVKKVYKDDPVFAKAKVVCSLYNDEFNKPLNPEIKSKALYYEGITKKDLDPLKTTDYAGLTQLALNFCDGAVLGSEKINNSVLEYINTINKPVLSFHSKDTYVDAINNFYDQIINIPENANKKK